MLEKGGNAFDAAVAAGFVLQVVEPHLIGPGGDVPAIYLLGEDRARSRCICGQGTAPAGATIEHYRSEGLTLIPGAGLLATVVPGAFDGWMPMLRDHGTTDAARRAGAGDLLCRARAIRCCRASRNTIAGLAEFFEQGMADLGSDVAAGRRCARSRMRLFRNPALAETWQRILGEAEAKRRPRGADRGGARRVLSRLRRRGDRPLLPRPPR